MVEDVLDVVVVEVALVVLLDVVDVVVDVVVVDVDLMSAVDSVVVVCDSIDFFVTLSSPPLPGCDAHHLSENRIIHMYICVYVNMIYMYASGTMQQSPNWSLGTTPYVWK